MPIPIDQLIKGRISQSVVEIMFERTEYRVARLGIEELFREVRGLTSKEYSDLKLPNTLRHMPDLLVATKDLRQAWLVEVKFRKSIDSFRKGFADEVQDVLKFWPNAHILVLLGESPLGVEAERIQDYARVIPPKKDLEWVFGAKAPRDDARLWDELWRLEKVFPGFDEARKDLDKVIDHMRALATA